MSRPGRIPRRSALRAGIALGTAATVGGTLAGCRTSGPSGAVLSDGTLDDGHGGNGAMVREGLIPMALARCDLPASTRVGLLGWSMGGFGALLLAGDLGAARVNGVVAASAALWRSGFRPSRRTSSTAATRTTGGGRTPLPR